MRIIVAVLVFVAFAAICWPTGLLLLLCDWLVFGAEIVVKEILRFRSLFKRKNNTAKAHMIGRHLMRKM